MLQLANPSEARTLRLTLLLFLVRGGRSEGDGRFAGVLVIVAELDHVARAIGRVALAAQGLRMHRQQVLLEIAQADVLVVGRRFHVVQGEVSWGTSKSYILAITPPARESRRKWKVAPVAGLKRFTSTVPNSPVLHAPPVSSTFLTVFFPLIWILR